MDRTSQKDTDISNAIFYSISATQKGTFEFVMYSNLYTKLRFVWSGAGQLPYKESSGPPPERVPPSAHELCYPLTHPWIQKVGGVSPQG